MSTRADSATFVVTTGWNQLPENGRDAFSKTLGSYGTFEFTGSSLQVSGQYGSGYGVMKITVDDSTPVLVDLAASTPGPNQLLHDFDMLDYNAHKVVIELVNNDGEHIVVNSFETRQ